MPKTPHLRRVPDADRLRVSRACAVCRARKSRCVVTPGRSACERCTANGGNCDLEVSSGAQPPSLSPTTGANSERSNDPAKLCPSHDRQTDSHRSPMSVLGGSDRASITGTILGSSPGEASSMNTAKGLEDLESAPNDELDGTILTVEDLGRTQYTGLRSNESFLLSVQDVLHRSNQSDGSNPTISHDKQPKHGTVSPQSLESVEALRDFPPQEIASFLVSTFFYYVEATFYYCDREWFYTTLNSVYNGTASPSTADDAFICFALLVFAFGSQFAHLRSGNEAHESPMLGLDPGKQFYDCAQKLIPRIIAKCTLKGIQVCLLAGLYNLPYNLPDTSYLYLGMAMRMSIASGLHRKTVATGLDSRIREVRNRLWWSVYSIDKRTSIALGRPATISEDVVDTPAPSYHPVLDNLEYQSNIQHQIEHLKLTKIITQIVQNSPLESKASLTDDLSRQLKQWRSELFSNLHPNDLLPSERNFRTTVHLHIHYHWAWILIGRASLLQLSRERLQSNSASTTAIPNQDQLASRSELAVLCVDAAKATIQLILVLKKHNLLCRFSFTDHHASTAALIILILHSILQHGDETSKIIDDGVDMLRYMARGGCRGASSDLQTIEQLRAFASDLRRKMYQGRSHAIATVSLLPTSTQDSYQTWVSWMSEREASRTQDPMVDNSTPILVPGMLDCGTDFRSSGQGMDLRENLLDNMYSQDYRSLDLRNQGGFHNVGSSSALQDDFSPGFDWDDGRLDLLDVTKLLGSYSGQMTYNAG